MEAFRDRVFLMCRRASRSDMDAEDLAQEAFIRVWKGLGAFKGDSSLTTWIYRIVWNVCADYIKRRGQTRVVAALENDNGEDLAHRSGAQLLGAVDPEMGAFETRQYINVLFEKLPEMHRLILTLFYLNSLSYEKIAQVTGWPLGTVKATLHRAKARLKEAAKMEIQSDMHL